MVGIQLVRRIGGDIGSKKGDKEKGQHHHSAGDSEPVGDKPSVNICYIMIS